MRSRTATSRTDRSHLNVDAAAVNDLERQRAAARRTAWILAAVAVLVFAGFIALQGWLR